MKTDRLLTVPQVAETLSLKEGTVRAWMARRALPKVRLGKRAVRIPEAAVEKLIADGTIPARPPR
jgi:excisionase family DNA binding protein